jgi:hypothetical protein
MRGRNEQKPFLDASTCLLFMDDARGTDWRSTETPRLEEHLCSQRWKEIASGGALAKQVRQSQAAQLTAAQHSATDNHAEGSALFAAALFLFLVFLAVAPFAEEMGQG